MGKKGAEQVRDGFKVLILRAKESVPGAQIDGVAVAEMVTGGVETVIGVKNDPTFGPVVIFGLGGIFIEIMKDVTCRLAPFGVDEAARMIREIRSFEVLTGFRGGTAVDLKDLAETLALVSAFAVENAERIESLDINPYVKKGTVDAFRLFSGKNYASNRVYSTGDEIFGLTKSLIENAEH